MKMRLLIFVSLVQSHVLFGQPPAAASASSARPRAAAAAALYADEQNNPKEDVEEGYAQKLLTEAFPDVFRPAEPNYGAIPAVPAATTGLPSGVLTQEGAPAAAAGAGMGRQAQPNKPARTRAAGVGRGKAKSVGKESQANTYKVGISPTIGQFSSRDSLAILNSGSNNVNIFTVNPRTGVLHEVQGSPLQTSKHPVHLSFSADGNTLAVSGEFSSNVDIYSIDKQTGVWQAIKGSPFSMGRYVEGLSLTLHGNVLAVSYGPIDRSNPNIPNIIMYHIDHQKTKLTPLLLLKVDDRVMDLSISPDGNILACYGIDFIHILAYDAQTRSLKAVQGSPFHIKSGPRLMGYKMFTNKLSFSADGTVLAAANHSYKRVEIFTINQQTNTVRHVPFDLGFASHSVSLSENGGLLAIGNWRKPYKVGIFIVDKFSGKLKALQGSPFKMEAAPEFVSLSPNGRFLAVASSAALGAEDRLGTVSMYEIDSENGTIRLITIEAQQKQLKESLVDTALLPQDIVKGPLYEYLYGPEYVVAKPVTVKETREEIRERDAQKNLALTQQQRANQENDKRALFKAIAEASIVGVEQYLTPFTVNAKADEDGKTPLMRAVSGQPMSEARLAIARKILNYIGFKYHTLYKEQAEEVKPSLELTDNFGNTALKLAEIHGHIVLAKEIRDKMAAENPSAGSKRKRS